jgi:glutamate dehydrogenase (NAD(P)+)
VHHNLTLGPGKGGIRFHPEVDLAETGALSMLMTFKNSLMGLPLGGAKGGVRCDPGSMSRRELQSLTRRYTTEITRFIGPNLDIPAPDMGTNGQTMAWIMDTYSTETGWVVPGVVTGKPIEVGGSQGRVEATGRGVAYTVVEAAKHLDFTLDESIKVAVQGFGNVGSIAAKKISKLGCTIVAVSDVKSGLYNPKGLDLNKVTKWVQEHRFLEGYPEAEHVSNMDLLELPCDILIPAATSGQITSKNAQKIKARVVAEGANGPMDLEATDILTEKGVFIIPDILCNAGGVTVSYFEWIQGNQSHYWSEKEVNNRLWEVLSSAFQNVIRYKQKFKCDMRTASMMAGIRRISRAMLWRGFFP